MSRNTIAALRGELEAGRVSCCELLERSFERIDDPSGEGARAFIRRFRREAQEEAARADASKCRGALGGILLAVKDLFDVAGSVTTAGSIALRDFPSAKSDAPVVARLRAAGAVIIGTNNMTEFAMGGVGINPHYGTPLNPWDRTTGRIPGGSSSGGAVAVADGMVPVAIGSDTAGSIQMPAAFCGITGFKPTARRVSREGAIPLARSLDSIGPLGNSVACCALVDSVIVGEPVQALEPLRPSDLHFAVPESLVLDDLEPSIAQAFSRTLNKLSGKGVRITHIRMTPLTEIPTLSFSVVEGYAWHRKLLQSREALYDPIVARRFANGANVLAADYIDLLEARARIIRDCEPLTRGFDAVVMPTVPLVPPRLADFKDNEALWLATNRCMIRNPGVANFLDRCAISLPCHETGAAPVGFSLMGETMGDRRLLAVAASVEEIVSKLP